MSIIYLTILASLLAFRSFVDIFSNVTIIQMKDGQIILNLASLLAIIIIVFGLYITASNRVKLFKLLTNPALRWFFLVLLVFLIYSVLSIIFSEYKIDSSKEIIRLASIFILFISGFIIINSEKKLLYFISFILISALVPFVASLYQIITNDQRYESRIYGTFFHPNPFSFYLLLLLALTTYLVFSTNISYQHYKKLAPWLLIIIALLIFFTQTRSIWFASVLFILLISMFKNYKVFFAVILLGCMLVVFQAIFEGTTIENRISDILYNPFNSLVWRLEIWQDAFNLAREKFIFGYGLNTAAVKLEYLRGTEFGSTELHNDYLKMFFELGIIGLFLYLLIFVFLIRTLFQPQISYDKKVVFGIFISIIFLISFFDNVLRVSAFQYILWTSLGGVMGSSLNKFEKEKVPTTG